MALASVVVVLIVCRLPGFAFIAAGGLHPLRQQEPPDVYAIIAPKKNQTQRCKSHSSGSRTEPPQLQRTSCRLLFEEGAPFLFFCCFFLVNLLQAASPPSSLRHFFQFLFFFVIPSHGVHCRPMTVCLPESHFVQCVRDFPRCGRSELIRRITRQRQPRRGSRGAAAIRHRLQCVGKDSSSGLLTVRLPPSAEEDRGSITHHWSST